ncbi:uncharacterized protein LOC121467361 [Drosophila elegans]|uniref:uncharacterized protein LOC121467361 n=1 Tax=Drosophila elegans TaxID=30023 RepID=UPI001BC84134|nr:uncharacterized protein LOC121467361 [Drosophila elegans]
MSLPRRTHPTLGAPREMWEAHPISGRPESIPGGLGLAHLPAQETLRPISDRRPDEKRSKRKQPKGKFLDAQSSKCQAKSPHGTKFGGVCQPGRLILRSSKGKEGTC